MSGQLNYPKSIDACKPGASRTIFDGPGQCIEGEIDVASIKLLEDRVIILDIPQDDSTVGSLVIPDVAQNGGVGKGGNFRIGLVVAVGPGDKFLEVGSPNNQGVVGRKLITAPCSHDCQDRWFDVADYEWKPRPCPFCDNGGDGRIPVVVPPQCKVGDRVLYDRRRHEELILNGQRYALMHAEQAAMAVLED